MVGEVDDSVDPPTYKIFTHKKLDIGYNGNQVVDVNLTSDVRVKLAPHTKITFSYEVQWRPSSVNFVDRFDKYLDPTFFQHRVITLTIFYNSSILQIHWFSIFNSFMMVIFLVGLVWMILMRTLRKDYARYQKDDDVDDMVS